MDKIFPIFLLINILLLKPPLFAQENVILRFYDPSTELVTEIIQQNHDIAAYIPEKYLDIIVNKKDLNSFQSENCKIEIVQTNSQLAENLLPHRTLAGYRTYTDIVNELHKAEQDYPDICKLYDIGDSRGKLYTNEQKSYYSSYNHDILALKISDNANNEEDEPSFFFFGAHHAREPISTEVVMTILNNILVKYGTDPQVTKYVDNSQIWIVPLVNPDGHKYVIDESNKMWRKNILDNNNDGTISDGSMGNTIDGVDLNRNYGWNWSGNGSSSLISSSMYCGPSEESEPEVKAIVELLKEHQFVAGISYHSYGELVLYPYGHDNGVTAPDNSALKGLSDKMASNIKSQEGGTYTSIQSLALYPAAGTLDDYAYGEHGIFSYCIELASNNQSIGGFIPPQNQIKSICDNNIDAAMILLNRINYSTLTGHIRDSQTKEPINANIFVKGIDDQGTYRNPYKSDKIYGRYYRFLKDGSYTVIFSSEQYYPDTFDVVITETGPTVLDVSLVPNNYDIIISKNGNLTKNIKAVLKTRINGFVELVLPSVYKSSSIKIYNSSGKNIDFSVYEIVSNNNTCTHLTIDISHLSSGIFFMRFGYKRNNYIYTLIL